MKTIHIITDSTTDLDKKVLEDHGVHVVPLTIQIDEKTYIDGVDIAPDVFLEKMALAKELPKSSQPAVGVFHELYDRLGADGSEIISIHMTGGMSGTVKSAQAAAEMSSANVTVIDSLYITKALAFQVIAAAEMVAAGKTVPEILEELAHIRKQTTLFVVVDKLDNLVKGGRIGKGRGLIGSLLKVKPIATITEGVYTPVAQVRSHKQVIAHLFKVFTEETKGKVVRGVAITHANGLALAEPLKKIIEDTGIPNVSISYTTPVISTHTGEGAIGFMYYTD